MYDPRRPPSMIRVDATKLEQLWLDLLSGILQQLVPSGKYLRHDHCGIQYVANVSLALDVGKDCQHTRTNAL